MRSPRAIRNELPLASINSDWPCISRSCTATAGLRLVDQDVFANVVGGVKITETGADLAALLAVLASFRDRILPRDLIVFGELGLTGELRAVANGQERLREAAKHGFKHAIVPFANRPKERLNGMTVHGVKSLEAALEVLSRF